MTVEFSESAEQSQCVLVKRIFHSSMTVVALCRCAGVQADQRE